MRKIIRFNKVWFYIVCMLSLSAVLASCETDDSDVSRLISGGSGGPAPEQPFEMKGTWVMGDMNPSVVRTVLGQQMEVGEAIGGMLLDVLNGALPLQFKSISDVEIGIKIEAGTTAENMKLSSPTLDLLVSPEQFALELPVIDEYTVSSEGTLAEMVGTMTLLNYVTEETPDGIKVSESPLAMLAETLGEKATLKSLGFAAETSKLEIKVAEETRTGEVTLTLTGKLKIDTANSGLVGIFLKSVATNVNIHMNLKQWSPLQVR